ncbi:MAG: hypothetical protein UR68_C0024G0007 [Candidatus Roizmanbacteria bacterium GW2011_GWA2_35_19]|uniref:Uncharacterized protein n=1 Tax=Candidatus Roizmanbacteria bacterium GW2011_GWA2_35_19 TaxID=1618478 RepID=A0A0G0BR15_9BACT|nr:MAG: hypothetical protein UR68_C0024G0007 [Candidatus Roizmanbacteria bacterium GW2011_GWA2_35_19]
MKTKDYIIIEEKNEIDDHLLDIIGNEFKFDHQKGVSELVKNSVAAYIRTEVQENKRLIYLRFTDSDKDTSLMECIDFVGMTSDQIITAFKRWGDPKAASYGYGKRVPGGHGNGGKFYMRQMFYESYFITYKNGLLNIYGFSPNKKYGFANHYKDVLMKPDEAIKLAGLNSISIPKEIVDKIIRGSTGFTVVRGIAPTGMKNKIQAYKICEKIRNHPQIRKFLERMKVTVVHNNKIIFDSLVPDKLAPKPGFEQEYVFEIPETLTYSEGGEKQIVEMTNDKFKKGQLVLHTSEEAMERAGRYGELNRIDILGELGVIASYQMYELGVNLYPQSVFIYGDCECSILEDPEDDCVKNDRSKLIAENSKTKALLQWLGERVNDVAEKILDKEREEQKKIEKEHSINYNNLLNKWSAKFMNRIRAELLVGPGQGPGAGTGTGGSSGGLGGNKGGDGGQHGSGEGEKEGGGNTPKKKARSPRVLLSGMDQDPFNPRGETLFLDPRQGIIYQRIQDVQEGIYWINTASPLAKEILNRFTEKSQQWRTYLFQRHVDILLKEELRNLFKRDAERFNPDTIDADIFGVFYLKIQEEAAKDLGGFLLEENFEVDK